MLSSLYSARSRRDADGFTLIELLVVVIIIGLLAAIALPIFIDQTKTSVDASVKSDVRNTITNVTNAQAQAATTAQAALSDRNTSVALETGTGTASAAAVIASGSANTFNNVPKLGVTYTVYGWNPNGKAYLGTGASGKGAWTYSSASGQFSQGGAAPDGASADGSGGSGSTGGSSQSAPQWTSSATLPNGTQGASYSTTLVASGSPTPTYALASGSTLPSGLNLSDGGVLSGTPAVTGSFTFTVNALNTTSSSNSVPRTFSLTLGSTAAYSANFDSGANGWTCTWVSTGGNPASGGYCSSPTAGQGIGITFTPAFQPNTTYVLSYDQNTLGGSSTLILRNTSSGVDYANTSFPAATGWVTKTVTFTTAATGGTRIAVSGSNAGYGVDNVTVTKAP